jgi:hypothetical protein
LFDGRGFVLVLSRVWFSLALSGGLALQLQGAFAVGLLRHGLMASSPDRPRDDERRLDPALG